MKKLLSVHWILITALWYFGSGVLHDYFVIKAHAGDYNRELLRLLMDGHVLIFSGVVLFVCYLMMLSKIQCGNTIAIIVAAFMLIYCLMILPFLASYLTMALSAMVIVVALYLFSTFPSIWNVMEKYRL
jgi:hypothetical protein